ncbi:MAG: glycosyltransferase, partial [Candidatus Dojkabacteria bacterium]
MKEIVPVSIIIPAKNEGLHLPRLLKSIQDQDVQPLEVIVSEYDSDDDTVNIAKSFGATVIEGGMPGVGRNKGAEVAKAENLMFMDADTYFLEKGDLLAIYKKFEEKKYDIASCYFKTDSSSRSIQNLFNLLKWFATW